MFKPGVTVGTSSDGIPAHKHRITGKTRKDGRGTVHYQVEYELTKDTVPGRKWYTYVPVDYFEPPPS